MDCSTEQFFGDICPRSFNQFNGSNQFNYAAKHNPQVFSTDTNGGNDATPANPLSTHYAPLQQLFVDLANDTVAEYNWITPNQFNDMHTTLAGGYKGLTGDPAKIRQGDDFLSQIVPVIMASNAYKNHGAIIIWFDESEPIPTPIDAQIAILSSAIPKILLRFLKSFFLSLDNQPAQADTLVQSGTYLRRMEPLFATGTPLRLEPR